MMKKPVQIKIDKGIWAEVHKRAILEEKTVVTVTNELLRYALKNKKV